jgi:hypothetical protein
MRKFSGQNLIFGKERCQDLCFKLAASPFMSAFRVSDFGPESGTIQKPICASTHAVKSCEPLVANWWQFHF